MRPVQEAASWRRVALESMPPVAWLADPAPHGDVVLSSRCRYMRNLVGFKFPHACSIPELREVQSLIQAAARQPGFPLEPLQGLTNAERDHLVGARLLSPEFAWQEPGRSILLDGRRALALMINEEDHMRLQAITAGWSIDVARNLTEPVLERLATRLDFAVVPPFGFVSASLYNCGLGRRLSAMFHLIGLAQARRLPAVLHALAEKNITARGLFGESSRAVGAFVQVSTTGTGTADFVGAAEYLMREEREARASLTPDKLRAKVDQALTYSKAQKSLSLADALRVLAWVRLAATFEDVGPVRATREADSVLSRLDLRGEGEDSGIARADYLRKSFRL